MPSILPTPCRAACCLQPPWVEEGQGHTHPIAAVSWPLPQCTSLNGRGKDCASLPQNFPTYPLLGLKVG